MALLKGRWLFSLPTIDITFGTRMMKSRLPYLLLICLLNLLVFQAYKQVFTGGQKYPSDKAVVFTINDYHASAIHSGQHETAVTADFIDGESNDDDEYAGVRKKITHGRYYATTGNMFSKDFFGQFYNKPGPANRPFCLSHDKYIFQRTLRV